MSFSNYSEDKILDHVFGGTAFTAPSAWYVKLHTGDPGEAGTANAATETTRKSVTSWAASSGGSKASSAAVSWTSYPAAETITHVSIWDASTSGNCLGSGALTASKTLAIGDTLTINSGSITITLD